MPSRSGRKGWIYFIQPVNGGLIKIGWSLNSPERRLRQIQFMSPVPLKIIGKTKGVKALEGVLHRRFADLRQWGEWFLPDATLLDYIEEKALS